MRKTLMLLLMLGCLTGCKWDPDPDTPAYMRPLDKSFMTFARQTAKRYEVQWLPMGDGSPAGTGSLIDSHRCHWAFNFTSSKKHDLAEARTLAHAIASDLDEWLFANKAYGEWLKESHRVMEEIYPDTQPSIEDVGFKLSFWDETVDRPLSPYVAQVRFVEGELRFYYADPKTQALQEAAVVEKY